MPFFGCIFIRLQDITHILHHISLLTLKLHLLFVYLTDIQNLIYQVLNALGIMFDGLQLCLYLTSKIMAQQLMQWPHDQRQWRTDIVGGIDQELHLVFIELLTPSTDIKPHKE